MSYALLQNQVGIFSAEQVSSDGSNYNLETLVALSASVDVERLARAFDAVVCAHPYLNLQLVHTENQDVRLDVRKSNPKPTPIISVDNIETVRGKLNRVYDFFNDQLFRIEIYKTGSGNYLYTNFPHIIFDGWSYKLFFDEVSSVYNGEAISGSDAGVFKLHETEEALRASSTFEEEKSWYESEFAPFVETESLPLPDKSESSVNFEIAKRNILVDDAALDALSEKTQTSTYTIFMAAFALSLSKFSGEDKALLTTIFHGRNTQELTSALGMLVRTLPVAIDFNEHENVSDIIKTLREQNLKTRQSSAYSFADLSQATGIKSSVLFAYQGAFHAYNMNLEGENFEVDMIEAKSPGLDFTVQVFKNSEGYYVTYTYPAHKFTEQLIDNFHESYCTILNEFLCKECISDVEVSSAEQLAKTDAITKVEYNAQSHYSSITQQFSECVEKYPDAPAVVFKGKSYTFKQLDDATDRLATAIYKRVQGRISGKQPVVAILIPRNENMVIAPLACMKAGCAYQPLDPAYPAERLNFMVKDSAAALVIEHSDYSGVLTEYAGDKISTSEFDAIFESGEVAGNLPGSKPSDAFVLLYTSGSTGTPKGVVLEHQNIAAWCAWYAEYLKLDAGSNVACYASFGFDAHMSDIYPALTSGLCVHIIPEEIRLDLIALNNYFCEHNVVSTLLTTAVGTQFATNIEQTSLKYLLTGGEKLASIEPPKGFVLINVYGPTETTITVTAKKLSEREPNIPIGKNNSTAKLYVVDKFMHRVPVGAPGELVIAGPQVGREYLNRPDKTAETFIKNPFDSNENELCSRAYMTGDIVRFRENGDVEFVGRRDFQVKINGFRIELKEIEAVICEFEGISAATVQAFDEPGGGKFIAAYICADSKIDVEALNAFIAKQKPAYMVPKVTMQIDEIPFNINQKVDKRALPKPELTQQTSSEGTPAALNVLEEKLKALIARVLGTDAFGLTDSLTAFGLTSINSIKLATKLFNEYGVSINALDLIESGSLQSIENEVLAHWMNACGASAAQEQGGSAAASKQNVAATSSPLSFAQQGVYTECLANPSSTFYNIAYSISFPHGTNANALKEAVEGLYALHPALKCHFKSRNDGSICACEIEGFKLSVPVTEMSESEFQAYKTAYSAPLDLETGPLSRFEVVCVGQSVHLLMCVHHLIADGASVDIMLRDLCALYSGKKLEAESYTCYDCANSQQLSCENEQFFDTLMAGVEQASQLIPDVYDKNAQHNEGTVSVESSIAPILEYAKANGVTPASVYLAAVFLAVSRYTYESNVAIATISNGRSDVRLANTVGMFVNTLPLALNVENGESALSFIKRVSEVFANVIRHENHPFAKIASKYDFKPQISYAYQVGVLTNYETNLGSLECEELGADKAKLPISVQICGSESTNAQVQVNFDAGMFSEAFAKGFARSIAVVAGALISAKSVSDISLTNETDWQKLNAFNQTMKLGFDKTDSVVSKFKKIAAAHPNKTAAMYENKSYTYAQLDSVTDRLATCIYDVVSTKCGKADLSEEVVSVIIPRSEWVFLLPLAVLKTGCAYEPLDASYPRERLNFMVKDANASLLLADDALAGLVDEYTGSVLLLSELMAAEEALESAKALPAPKAQSLMCLLYTSGTTGKPKGCQIEHGNMVAFAYGSNEDGFYTTDGKTASFASFGFDVCMADTFCTLLNGATLVVIPEDVRMNLDKLAAYFNEVGITQVLLTTQVGVGFVQNYPKMRTLRYLVMGGEKLPSLNPSDLSYTIINGYGPTENCCGVSLFPIKFWEENVPIGKPLKTIKGYVLDKCGHRLPAGAAGEYCVSGPQAARGYLNRPDKTAEAFSASPFDSFRMYHTGDIVRYRQNGDVEFVGRMDGQVKIRGFRVEVKEVETVIREYPAIKDATVVDYAFENGGKYLAAYIVSDENVDIDALNKFIESQKPAYMVPACTMQIEKIPLTVNQKVDKKALPKPEVKRAGFVEPANKAEEDFCSVFSSVLKVEKVGALDDFFELGGSSITAMRVVVAGNKLGYGIVYQNVFECTTPRALAKFAGGESVGVPDAGQGDAQGEEQAHVQKPASADAAAEADVAQEQAVASGSLQASFYGAGTTEVDKAGYDYRAINDLLRANTLDAAKEGARQAIGNVLLLGATGFLGAHVLYELIENSSSHITCIVRATGSASASERLSGLLSFYFGAGFASKLYNRVTVVEGDATQPGSLNNCCAGKGNVTVINCAASVKHFAKDDVIEKTNIEIVRNLCAWCLENGARLVHVSTESVFGHPANGVPREGFIYDEHMLFVGQTFDDNQYVRSKFLAERLIYENILEHNLNAKVLRAGNLAPRFSDGKFQKNASSNNYMNTLKGFCVLEKISYDVAFTSTEFSPIDYVAKAVVELSATPKECVCFMVSNNHRPLMGDVVEGLKAYGYNVNYVENEEFATALNEALNNPEKSDFMSPFLAYASNAEGSGATSLPLDSLSVTYTSQVLARAGFRWPVCGIDYCKRFLSALGGFEI